LVRVTTTLDTDILTPVGIFHRRISQFKNYWNEASNAPKMTTLLAAADSILAFASTADSLKMFTCQV
jgi:hypothetical protein